MKFEHLIEINDALNPLSIELTRAQLWHGLVLRAEAPTLFMPHLDDCKLTRLADGTLLRSLRYGTLIIDDQVRFQPESHIDYLIPAQGEITESNLRMAIEEPAPQQLFIRFIYDDGQVETADSMAAFYAAYRRSAYQEADIDTVRIIRQLLQDPPTTRQLRH